MCTLKTFAVGLGLLGMMFAFPVTSWAIGGGGDCLTDNAGGKAITGTVATFVSAITGPNEGTEGTLDSELVLKKKGKNEVFRIHVPSADITTPDLALCAILLEGPRNGLGETIQEAFGLGSKVLCLNASSIPSTDFEIIAGSPSSPADKFGFSPVTLFVEDSCD